MADATLKPEAGPVSTPLSHRLESWKEIAAYLKRDLRTVQRWEKREGLPVHRHMHSERGSVYAFKPEIDAWWANGRTRLDSNGTVTASAGSRPARKIPIAALIGLAMVSIGWFALGLSRRNRAHFGEAGAINGPTLRRLQTEYLSDPYAMPSPDGKKLAYFDTLSGPFRMVAEDLGSGQKQEFSENGGLFQAWSPDGLELAFREDRAVKIASLTDGAKRLLLTSADQRINPVDWSQDGKTILAITRNENEDVFHLATISIANGDIQPVKNWETPLGVDSTPQISPDGRFVALTVVQDVHHEHCYIYSRDGNQRTRLTNYRESDNDPVWSPDGKYVAFRRANGELWDLWAVGVSEGKPAGEPFLIKTDIGNRVWLRRWTTAGQLEFLQYSGGMSLFSIPVDAETGRPTGKPERLIRESPDNSQIAWLPGKKSFLFLSQKRGFGWPSLNRAPGKSAEEEEILAPDYYITDPIASPDGGYVAFAGWDAKAHLGIFLATLKTRRIQPLVPQPNMNQDELSEVVGWLPGSRRLVFGNPHHLGKEQWEQWEEDIFSIGLEGSGRRRIVKIAGGSASLSPDGTRIAYADWENRSIEVFSIPEQRKTVLARHPRSKNRPSFPRWSPDGTKIVYQVPGESGSPNQLWVVAASGGEAFEVVAGTPDAPYPWGPRWSPDGTRIAYTSVVMPTGYQLWAIEGFLPPK